MPICIPLDLPARKILEDENIFVIDRARAEHQDIRPLRVLIFNLMPTKIATETQFMRLLGNSPLQIEADLLQTASYCPKNTPAEHLQRFYTTFEQVKGNFYDAMVVTGAPVERMDYADVAYWDEICAVFEWANGHVFSLLSICWAAQAALYYYYGVPKYPLPQKRFGVFEGRVAVNNHPLLRGFDDIYHIPHSHHTEVRAADIEALVGGPRILASSAGAGPDIAATDDLRRIFSFGHMEYDTDTLDGEYRRDVEAGRAIALPCHYYENDDASLPPINTWRGHANLFFANWINTVYQLTPYDLSAGF